MKKNAFSLVELSIVLIIIGLLIAGISSGAKLIDQAKINKAVSDLRDYKSSYLAFVLTYDKIPGDMGTATEFFGTGTTDNPISNGNDNSKIEASTSKNSESLQAWKHMSQAEVISGSFAKEDGGRHYTTISSPKTAIIGTCYAPLYYDDALSNGIMVGKDGTMNCSDSIISPITAYKVDSKIDDGTPLSGIVMGIDNGDTCHDDANYLVSSNATSCYFFYSFGDS